MSRARFEAAAATATAALGPVQAKAVAGLLAQGRSPEYVLAATQTPAALDAVRALLDAADADRVSPAEAAAYLRGYAAGWVRHRQLSEVRGVWSGPATPGTPARSTAQVLIDVVGAARHRLVAMTYAARPYPPLTAALADALARGVEVDIVVETLTGADGLLGGAEPAQAFAELPGLRLWYWPAGRRTAPRSRQHAKLAVADDRMLFLTSANLTASGVERNIEAGVVVSGGTLPRRMAEHIRELQRRGTLQRWSPGAT